MNASEFVNALSQIEILEERYRSIGLSSESIEKLKNKYVVNPKGENVIKHLDPIESLVLKYDVSNIQIGMISFQNNLKNRGNYTLVGKDEVDDLAIDRVTGEIVVLEEESTRTIQYCAKNGNHFLSAILEMAKFFEQTAVDDELFEDEEANLVVAESCGLLAGGSKYYNFFKNLTGY